MLTVGGAEDATFVGGADDAPVGASGREVVGVAAGDELPPDFVAAARDAEPPLDCGAVAVDGPVDDAEVGPLPEAAHRARMRIITKATTRARTTSNPRRPSGRGGGAPALLSAICSSG
ncbi:hypothetical protein [Streptomyces rhizosphaericus]|uniref:Uncharacterized protein n=1 Tax=Streptomyces rhizosphaericus TaxID=114699 RepID=A0A6G4A9V1_9ACTN|nr:hypothetical protein [Streptomyces rhizosphaericus]NEW70000.1 hypothetical protein [Streptomyces rhizosphaericus]